METDKNDNRSGRAALASETLATLAAGYYTLRDGRRIEITAALRQCVAGTKLVLPESLNLLVDAADAAQRGSASTRIEVVNETTLNGIHRLRQDSTASIAALNFASAKNPGGGFLGGSQAQEESLARSSGLYASLSAVPEYYEYHRAHGSALYSDRIVWTPDCPIFRDDTGALLDEPHSAAFLTCAAPNAGAVHQNAPEDTPLIAPTLRRRAECVLAVAAAEHCDQLVLGAWGCGVFRNDPQMVADTFRILLDGRWRNRFARVRFSVLDSTPEQRVFSAFKRAFGGA